MEEYFLETQLSLNQAIDRALCSGAQFEDLVLIVRHHGVARVRFTMATEYGPLQVWPSPYVSQDALFDRRALGVLPAIPSHIIFEDMPVTLQYKVD